MKQHYDNAADFAADVAKHARGAWVNGHFDVNGSIVAIKAYGTWVQRINVNCLTDSGEFRTQRDMRAFIANHIGD